MSKLAKLLQKARTSPKNLRFDQLCLLCEYSGMELMGGEGSHRVYKCKNPSLMLSIQEGKDGKAMSYQVRKLVDLIDDNNLIKE